MTTQITVVTLLLCLLGMTTALYDPLTRFPDTPDWTNTTVFNQPITKWVYHHLALTKISAAQSGFGPASFYGKNFGGSARASAVLWDCIYDAYVAGIDPNGWNTVSGVNYHIFPKLNENQVNKAMAYAAYTASMYNFAFLGQNFVDYINNALIAQYGANALSDANSTDTSKPAGVGNLACRNVLNNYYNVDGTNFNGDNPNAVEPGVRFSDYTNFQLVNDPFPTPGHTDCSKVRYIDSWQPARTSTGQVLLWSDQTIFVMKSLVLPWNGYFRPPPMPKNTTSITRPAWEQRNEVMRQRSANLGDFEKAIATYYQDGEGYSGTAWTRYAASAADKKKLNLKGTIQLNFLIAHAQMEGYIVQYEGKRFYNGPRPTTPLQCFFKGQPIQAWKGPYLGVGTINGSDWTAYLAASFVQNPTPEYPCGHCTHSGSVGAAFKKFFGDDTFIGYPRTYKVGTFGLEPKVTDPSDPFYRAGLSDHPNTGKSTTGYAPAAPVTLNWNTWTELTQQASLSRTYLGVHFDDSNQVSYANGRNVGEYVYNQIKAKFWGGDNPANN